MSLTITIPGAVNVTTGAMAPAVLTVGVGVPGAQGPQGPAGPGVPAGGTAGQYLQKIDGTNYNTDWVTLNLSAYAPLASPAFTGDPTAPTAALGDNDTSLATTAFVQQELLSGTANAKNLEVYVRNQTGSTLAAGAIVYVNGATGNRPTVTLAQANNDANSAQTMGFVKTAIANNGFGYVIVRGECENLDTSAVAEGTQLYLSPTVAGTYTTTKPSAPDHLVYVGIVIRSHPTQGVILVAVQNGYELNELHDVAITSPTNGQVLKYNSTTGLWYNGTDSAGVAWGGITGTLSSQTDLQTALDGKYSTTNPAGYITSSALTGYATESFVTSQGYITSSALSPYAPLAGATFTGKVTTIASTTGTAPLNIPHGQFPTTPNDGDIWTTGTGIFSQVNGLPFQFAKVDSPGFSGTPTAPTATAGTSTTQIATTAFVTTADNLKANLASPTFTGVPAAPTAAVDTNTTQLATTAYVVGQGYAKLASPALTGTPTAPTASPGTNTTQLATTAFVTAAVPAIATVAQVYASTSGTTATPPLLAPLAFNSGGYFPRMNFASSSSGTGAGVGGADHRFEIIGPNVATAGFAQITSEHQQLWSAGTTYTILQFSKPVWFSFRMCNFSATYDGDAQTEIKAFIGNAVTGGVDPSAPAVGIYKAGGAGSFINLMVHNGTTLTKVATTTTFNTTVIDVAIYSNNGTVNLYLNGVLAATTTSGPTGTSNTTRVIAAVKASATAAVRQLLEIANIKVFAPQ